MVIFGILLDRCPGFLRSNRGARSLLLAPLGTGSLLTHMAAQLKSAELHGLTVVPSFPADEAYTQAVHAVQPDAIVLPPAQFTQYLAQHELADRLLIVEASWLPPAGYELERLREAAAEDGAACHLLHQDLRRGTAEEQVLYDRDGRVRSIQRLYPGVTQIERLTVSCSLISVAAARCLRHQTLLGLSTLRTQLAAAGVPSRDLSSKHPAINLAREAGLLALHERLCMPALRNGAPPPFTTRTLGVWTAPPGNIHPTAQFYGPVIAHADVEVGAHAVILGPTVLGSGARVGAGATVAQSIVWHQMQIPPGEVVTRRVVAGHPELEHAAPPEPRAAALSLSLPETPGEAGNELFATETPGGRYAPLKRATDFLLALAGLIVLMPLFVVVALILKLTSPGPLFFGHDREGRGGRVFRCWKFRTMVDRAHTLQRKLYAQNSVDGPQFKLPNDPRVTLVGRWLRATNIDELPQLFNVLCGDMSLIGPRPSPFRENQICVPWRNARLAVRPGITGLWQVCRHERAAGDFHQWIHFDMLYVRHLSFWLDLRILLATAVTLSGRWPVPVRWMIPAHRLRGRTAAAVVPVWAHETEPELAETPVSSGI